MIKQLTIKPSQSKSCGPGRDRKGEGGAPRRCGGLRCDKNTTGRSWEGREGAEQVSRVGGEGEGGGEKGGGEGAGKAGRGGTEGVGGGGVLRNMAW